MPATKSGGLHSFDVLVLTELRANEPEEFRWRIREALRSECGRKDRAAKRLHISVRTLSRWLKADPTLAGEVPLAKPGGWAGDYKPKRRAPTKKRASKRK